MKSTINGYLSKHRYYVIWVIILFTVVMLYLTLSPEDDLIPSPIFSYDKLGHFLMFGIWSFLLGYYWFLARPKSLNLFLVFLIGVLFGIAIELLQYYMPFHRDADIFDVAFDTLGCFIATLALYKTTRNHKLE